MHRSIDIDYCRLVN